MIEISIVTGTYNRIESLKRMVSSVRRSAGDVGFEIVLVDGGSKDGTIEWCKTQPDIVLIEQGKLLGAVRAFNDGAEAARGRYVVLANDDICFIDESILRAFAFMEDHPSIGVGCFYQNRDGKQWHVEQMPAVDPTGRQCSAHYGQVCIVPKWLGDEVGWWGDYLHTYGGDNELSANVWEAGYIVHPIECCCIADMMIRDDLRLINGGDPYELSTRGSVHPDSAKWRDKWTKDDKTGPRISTEMKWGKKNMRRMRVMYAPIFEPNNNFQRVTKRGLRDSLSKRGSVLQHDYMREGLEFMFDRADAFNPDLFLFQIQNVNPFSAGFMKALKNEHPNAVFVNWNGDYHPENLFDPAYIEMMKEFDLAGFVTTQIADRYDKAGIKWFYWQIGYEEAYSEPIDTTPVHDVVYLGNCYTMARKTFGEFLIDMKKRGINVGLYGSWPYGWAAGTNLYNFEDGRRIYRNAKLAISTQQYPEGRGFVSNRLFQSLAAGGAMVLQQWFDGLYDLIGLEDGKHLVTWRTNEELEEKIRYYLKNEDERKSIALAGEEYALENFSFDKRVDELFEELNRLDL